MAINNRRVRINVGGTIFEVYVVTLSESAYFTIQFSERWNTNKKVDDEDRILFIDRSAIRFDHVLGLLRDPHYNYPTDADSLKELDFYGIEYHSSYQPSSQDKIDYVYGVLAENKCRSYGCSADTFASFDYCENCGEFLFSTLQSQHDISFVPGMILRCDNQFYRYVCYEGTSFDAHHRFDRYFGNDFWFNHETLDECSKFNMVFQRRKTL